MVFIHNAHCHLGKAGVKLFEGISKPLSAAIRQLGAWRKEWLADKKHWNEWQSSLLKEGELDPLKSTFEKAKDTIDTALNLVNLQLEAMLRAQEKAGHIQERISALGVELNALIEDEQRSTLLDESAPMFSSHFFSQFKSSASWSAVIKGPDEILAMRCAMHSCETAVSLMQEATKPGLSENDI